MKRRSSHALPLNPFLMWTDLAFKTAEMMTASAQVIGHRSCRMAAARTPLSVRDRREFALMGQEKVDAAAASAQAMTRQFLGLDPLLGVRASRHMFSAATAMMSLAGSRTLAQMLARQARLLRVAQGSTATFAKVASASARVAHSGLKPVHARATANAKRLGKR